MLTCSHCKDTKRFLSENGVSFELVNFDLLVGDERSEALQELKKVNPLCTFPTIVVGDKVIVGFKKDELKAALFLD